MIPLQDNEKSNIATIKEPNSKEKFLNTIYRKSFNLKKMES